MKKTILTLSLFLTVLTNYSQLKFYTNGGKTEVKQGKCGMSDLSVKVPLPAGITKYTKVRFFVFLTPNRSSASQAIYHCVWEKEELAGKTEIVVPLKKTDGSNDFYYGGYGIHWGTSLGSQSSLNIDNPCTDESRAEQIWNLSFELEGLTFLNNSYIDGLTDGVKHPTYQATSIKKWDNAIPFDYGFADPSIYTADKSFSVKKTYDFPVRIDPYEKEMTLSFNGSDILGQIKSVSGVSAEEVKQDFIKALKNNTLLKKEETKLEWNIELCYPCYAKKIKGSSDADSKMKEICNTPADWKPVKISGRDGFVLDIPRTLHFNRWNKEYLSASSEPKWSNLLVFVVEHNGKIFTGTLEYRSGDDYAGESLPAVEKFFKDVLNSFKAY